MISPKPPAATCRLLFLKENVCKRNTIRRKAKGSPRTKSTPAPGTNAGKHPQEADPRARATKGFAAPYDVAAEENSSGKTGVPPRRQLSSSHTPDPLISQKQPFEISNHGNDPKGHRGLHVQ